MSSYIALAVSVGVLAVVATWIFFSRPRRRGALAGVASLHRVGLSLSLRRQDHGHAQYHRLHELRRRRRHGGRLLADGALGFSRPVRGTGRRRPRRDGHLLASKLPLLGTIPASVYGFASIAGLFLLGRA